MRRLSQPAGPNATFAGLVLGWPVAILAFVTLLVAGWPALESLLVAYVLQLLMLPATIILNRLTVKDPEPARPANDTGNGPPAIADIWRTYPSGTEGENPVRIALIAPDISQSRRIATDLAELGPEVHHSTDSDAVFDCVMARPEQWGAVIFDLDSAPDRDTGVSDLEDFQAACPGIQVLLLSGGSLKDQLTEGSQTTDPLLLSHPCAQAKGLMALPPHRNRTKTALTPVKEVSPG